MKKIFNSPYAPKAIGAYNQAVQAGNYIYLSGQIALDPETGLMRSQVFEEQVHQVFKNMRAVCQAAGGDLHDLVKLTVFLTDMVNFQSFNDIMMDYFLDIPYPARSAVACLALPKNALIEIEGILFLES